MASELAESLSFLLAQGHVGAQTYGWSWLVASLRAAARVRRQARAEALVDMRAACMAEGSDFKRYLQALSE